MAKIGPEANKFSVEGNVDDGMYAGFMPNFVSNTLTPKPKTIVVNDDDINNKQQQRTKSVYKKCVRCATHLHVHEKCSQVQCSVSGTNLSLHGVFLPLSSFALFECCCGCVICNWPEMLLLQYLAVVNATQPNALTVTKQAKRNEIITQEKKTIFKALHTKNISNNSKSHGKLSFKIDFYWTIHAY